ncbi:MAG: hemerythrin domain-containing protein [Allobranchiibius sp.]
MSDDHHAGLWSGLVGRVDAVVAAASADPGSEGRQLRDGLLDFLHGDVLAHLRTEEQILYSGAREAGLDALVTALELDHRFLMKLVTDIECSENVLQIALAGRALVTLVGLRIEKEETVLIPAMQAVGVEVSDLLDGMVVAMATNYDSHFTYL